MRNQRKDNLVFLVLDVALGKKVFQDRNLRQPGNAVQRPDILVFQYSAQNVHFSFFEANFMLDFPLADDGLADAADVRLPGHRGYVHRDFQRNFAGGVHFGCDVNIHANI